MSKLDALARGELAALVLRVDAALAAAQPRADAAVLKPVENVFHCVLPIPLVAAPDRPDDYERFIARPAPSVTHLRVPLPLVGRG